ncbi:MAG: DsbA family protein [Cycloclasticus sp.]|nr:disulfide bond formation protein DsbA [Cycloclasticus sp. 44_32_T64]
MSESKSVSIMHFSDVLCIWAYLTQIRMDTLKSKFGDSINLQYHFVQVFGSVKSKMEQNWNHRGGIEAYNKLVCGEASKFDHIEVHEDIWLKNTPTSSASCHLFLKAVQLVEMKGGLPLLETGGSIVETVIWTMRQDFFKNLIDISTQSAQMDIAARLGLPIDKIQAEIDTGAAFAALDNDVQLREKYRVMGSPTLVFNEGRQMIYGNVGYRVIEANVLELLSKPKAAASWC